MAKKYFYGFTLVELLIVVSIIAIMVVLAIAYFRGQLFKGNDAKRKSDIKRIQIAVEEYEKDNNCYPSFVTCNQDDASQPINPYLSKIPCDPVTKQSYFYEPDPGSLNCPRWYRLYTNLQNDSDIDTTSGIGPAGVYDYYASSSNAPAVTQSSTPQPTGGSGQMFYGCFGGVLLMIEEGDCENSFPSTGFAGACVDVNGNPANECIPSGN